MAGLIIGISSRPDILRIIRRRTPGRKTKYYGVLKLTVDVVAVRKKWDGSWNRPALHAPQAHHCQPQLAGQGVRDSGVCQGHLLLTNSAGRRPSTQTS